MKQFIIFSIALCTLAVTGCSSVFENYEVGDASSKAKVLIAMESSPFKEAAVGSVIDDLEKEGVYFKVIDLDDLRDTDTGDFDAVLLVCSMRIGSLDSRAAAYIRMEDADPVLLLTKGLDDPLSEEVREETDAIDVVSSASKTELAGKTAEKLTDIIRGRI